MSKRLEGKAVKTLGKFLRVVKALVLMAAGVLILIGLYKFGTILGFFLVYPWLLSKVLTSVNIDYHLAEIIALLVAAGLYYGVWRGIYKRHPQYGLACIIGLLILQSVFMFFSQKDRMYSLTTGEPIKYYTTNPLSGEIQVFDRPIYDALGQKAQPVTFPIAKEIYRQKNSARFPNDEVSTQSIKNFFDPMSGKALVYYCQNKEGLHFYLHEGFDPKTGLKLIPVTSAVTEDLHLQNDLSQKMETEIKKPPSVNTEAPPIEPAENNVPAVATSKMIRFQVAFVKESDRSIRTVTSFNGLSLTNVEVECESGIKLYSVMEYLKNGLPAGSIMNFRIRRSGERWQHYSIPVLSSYEDKIVVIPVQPDSAP